MKPDPYTELTWNLPAARFFYEQTGKRPQPGDNLTVPQAIQLMTRFWDFMKTRSA